MDWCGDIARFGSPVIHWTVFGLCRGTVTSMFRTGSAACGDRLGVSPCGIQDWERGSFS